MYSVFLVEDEPAILNNLKIKIGHLNLEDFIVTDTAYSAEEAWEKIQKKKPNVIISDIKMSGNGGLWLLQEVQKAYGKEIVCIALSAYNDFDFLQQCIRIGIDDYFLKPISVMQLKDKFQEIKALLTKRGTISLEGEGVSEGKDGADICEQIDSYIIEKYGEKISLEQLSQVFSYSTQHLCEMYKKKKGITLGESITKTKIEKAIQFMQQNRETPLVDIAESVGYQDYRYFCRVFKKTTGMTVSQYREQL